MPSNKIALGIIFAAINAFMLAGMSLFTKLLSQYYGSLEVVFFRNTFSVIALLVWLWFARKLFTLKTARPWAHLLRSVIGTIGLVCGTWALSMDGMPLAETTIMLFTAPLFVVLLSYPVLKEPVGLFRLGAVAVGFTGVVIMINPFSGAGLSLPFWGVVAGLSWGFFAGGVDICLRWMGKTENSGTTVFYFVLFGTIVTGLHWPWAQVQEGALSGHALLIICGLGTTGLLSLLAKTQSYRLAEAALIAPVMYSMIIWTMIFDYLFWDKAPTLNVILGAAVIIASNLFIVQRELRIKKKMVAPL